MALRGGLRRHAFGLWFCGLGALGLLRSSRYLAKGAGEVDAIAWAWLGGSTLVLAIGVLALVRGWRNLR